ncbi:MAG: recombinase family protein [Aristaeellaceae bacterium]
MFPTPKSKQLPPDIQKRAVAYARYSSAGQRDVSIDQQLRDIRAYAQREGYTIVHEYADHAKSGFRHIDARIAFNAMMEAAKNCSFGTIIVWKVDRFGRSREDSAIYKGRLRQYGVRVLYAMEPIPEGSAGVLLEGMLEATAEWYSRNLSENVARGLHDNALKSLANGIPYYGYDRSPDGHYIIDPAEAPIVRQIYEWYLSGMSSTAIIRELNARGLTHLGRTFTYNCLLRILHNERYTGIYIWGDIRNEGGMPAIITHEQWEEVQRQLSKRQKRDSKSQVNFLLTGKLFCGHCGMSMAGDSGTSRTGETHYYYACMNKKNRRSCDKRSIRKEIIEHAVINYLLDVALNPDTLSRLADLILAEQQSAQRHSVLSSLRSEHATIQRKITNVNNAIAEGIYTSSTLTLLQSLESEARSLSEAIAAAEFSESQLLTRERILYWMNRFIHGDRTDPHFSERLVNIFLNSVYLYDTDSGPRMRILLNATANDPPVPLSELPPVGSDCLSSAARHHKALKHQRFRALFAIDVHAAQHHASSCSVNPSPSRVRRKARPSSVMHVPRRESGFSLPIAYGYSTLTSVCAQAASRVVAHR